jgi:hypothetical protein
MILTGLGLLAANVHAQQRLQAPTVIAGPQSPAPLRQSASPPPVAQPAAQLGQQSQPAAPAQPATPAPAPRAPRPAGNDFMADMMGGPARPQGAAPADSTLRIHLTSERADNAPASTVIGGAETPFYGHVPSLPAPPPRSAQHEEMILRMRMAVEEVAAQYGNPGFAQVFTNDPVRAKVLRRRMAILKQVDLLNAEIATLETHKTQTQQELQTTRQRVETSKQELKTIEEQVREMNTRLQSARTLLQTLAQQ